MPYSPNPTPPPTTTCLAPHNKWTTTKPSYPQAHESTAGSKKLPGASTPNKHYSAYSKVTVCSLTTVSPKPRMNARPSPKNNTNNAKRVAIDSAHAQCNQPTIKLAQRGQNTAYHLGSAFNQTIKKLTKQKHVCFTKQNKVHKI